MKTSKYEKTLDDDNHIDDLAFLANIMELNEKLVELSSPDDVMHFEMEINKEIEQRTEQLEIAFNKNNLDSAFDLVKTLKYYKNIHESLKEIKFKIQ